MFKHLGEDAIEVILHAQKESRRLGYGYVGAEQILLGLLAEETYITAVTLKSKGLTLNVVRAEVQQMTGRANELTRFIRSFFPIEIPFTPRGQKVIEYSWDEAKRLQHDRVTIEHVLLGFLKEGRESIEAKSEGIGIKILNRQNIDLSALTVEIERLANQRLNWLQKYCELIERFLTGSIDTGAFSDEYVTMFKKETTQMNPNVFEVLDSLFGAAECYCPPELRNQGLDEFDTDESDVQIAAKDALGKLKELGANL